MPAYNLRQLSETEMNGPSDRLNRLGAQEPNTLTIYNGSQGILPL